MYYYIIGNMEKKWWAEELTDWERLKHIITFKYPWFTLELGLLAIACVYFSYLRLTIIGSTFLPNTCSVI